MVSADVAARILAEVMAAQSAGPAVVLATVIQAPAESSVAVGAKLLLRRGGAQPGVR